MAYSVLMKVRFLSIRAWICDSIVFAAASAFICYYTFTLGFASSSFEDFGCIVISDLLTYAGLGDGCAFLKSVALSLTLEPNDPTGFFGFPALAVRTPAGNVAAAGLL